MRRIVLKSLRFTLALVLTALVVATLGSYLALRASLPQLEGSAVLSGLAAPVQVQRDALGIASLQAQTRADAARALGYLHAQDRYFQMDLLRRSAAGELAGLVGAVALPLDREVRIHRLREHAGQGLAALPPEYRGVLQAYVDGVNAGLGALSARPFEYWLLQAQPAPWAAEDSMLAGYAMFLDLTDEDGDFERGLELMRRTLPPELLAFLVPAGTRWDAPLFGAARSEAPVPAPEVFDLRRQPQTPLPAPTAASGQEVTIVGSNAWAVDAAHSATGAAMVAGDMHLGHDVPQIWYRARMQVSQPALDLVGVTLPGLPMLIAGSNTRIAWAFTNSYADVTDVVALEIDPGNAERYRTPDGWRSFEHRSASLAVKGGPEEILEWRETIWGPVIPAPDGGTGGGVYALHWLGSQPDTLNLRLLDLEATTTAGDALALAPELGLPPQNLVVADRDGRIGWTIAGRLPKRRGLDGSRPLSWADGAGWEGWLAATERPQLLDPGNGRLWTANARLVDGDADRLVGDGGYDLGARQQQIRDALLAKDRLDYADMLAIQLDDRAVFLQRWRDLALQLLGPASPAEPSLRAEARAALNQWQARATTDSAGYRLVRSWRRKLQQSLFPAILAGPLKADPGLRFDTYKQSEGALWALASERPAHLLAPGQASWDSVLLQTLDQAAAEQAADQGTLALHPWGEYNTLAMQHPLARALPVLAPLLNMPAQPLPGDNNMPRVQSPRSGASQRSAVSPGREAEGYFHMPGGQSGHPLSPYYRAGHDAWVRGEPTPFLPGPAQTHLQLEPAP